MRFRPTQIAGAFEVEPEPISDSRGLFARTFCAKEFAAQGLDGRLVQCSVSFNARRGTLRGMHYQGPPHEEAKLVRCTRGAIYDVILDLRPPSPTFKKWQAFELSQDNRKALYIPPGVAHGFQTLSDAAEVLYQMSEFFDAASARGVRWNDPAFGIRWPEVENRIMSPKDAAWGDFEVGT